MVAVYEINLSMKKRYDEMLRCESIIHEALQRTHVRHTLVLRQLYHDREEVTGFVERLN